jgi:hypothetical protein
LEQVLLLEREFASSWQLGDRQRSADDAFSGKSLAQAGPAPLFIGYTLVGFLCFLVMAALGEVCNILRDPKTSIVTESVANNLILRWLLGCHFLLVSRGMQLALW